MAPTPDERIGTLEVRATAEDGPVLARLHVEAFAPIPLHVTRAKG